MQRPKISIRGDDGLIELLRKRFGVGMGELECKRLREELMREIIERDVRARLAEGQTTPKPQPLQPSPTPVPAAPPPTPIVVTPTVNDSEVSAGVELIIGAIPGLQEMTIKVSDDGAASVDYRIKQVQVTTASSSLTVRR